ncbi:hypothetical protein P5673_000067 [Acropora cervicornis]|uniref:Uncharacterized protein n=1 Tax=Acropora cervicornis TaxID=6130 RepID=A0AAD9R6H7_ACRCE|nr:hypothetical protein P5673_000067 [Acropora cervicornis]
MAHMRSGLKPTVPSRHSPSKLPPVSTPVRAGWGTTTPPFTSVSNVDWTIEMVRGIRLKTGTKMPVSSRKSPSKSFVNDEPRTSSLQILPKHKENTVVPSPQNDMEKEIEKLKSKIMSLQKLIEQLKAEIKEKSATITELEKKLKTQETEFGEEKKKFKSIIIDKEKELAELKRVFDRELEELKAQHLKELFERDGKIKVMKMHMADVLKDKSRVTEETDVLKLKLKSMKSANQGQCQNCFVMEKQLQSKISELRDKEVVAIELQRLCSKMEKQLVQQVNLEEQRRKYFRVGVLNRGAFRGKNPLSSLSIDTQENEGIEHDGDGIEKLT